MADFGETVTRPWDWRKALAGCVPASNHRDGVRYFHAYDVNDNAACEPSLGLVASCEEVNEGSPLCPDCVVVAQANRAGRPMRAFGGSDLTSGKGPDHD